MVLENYRYALIKTANEDGQNSTVMNLSCCRFVKDKLLDNNLKEEGFSYANVVFDCFHFDRM